MSHNILTPNWHTRSNVIYINYRLPPGRGQAAEKEGMMSSTISPQLATNIFLIALVAIWTIQAVREYRWRRIMACAGFATGSAIGMVIVGVLVWLL